MEMAAEAMAEAASLSVEVAPTATMWMHLTSTSADRRPLQLDIPCFLIENEVLGAKSSQNWT